MPSINSKKVYYTLSIVCVLPLFKLFNGDGLLHGGCLYMESQWETGNASNLMGVYTGGGGGLIQGVLIHRILGTLLI